VLQSEQSWEGLRSSVTFPCINVFHISTQMTVAFWFQMKVMIFVKNAIIISYIKIIHFKITKKKNYVKFKKLKNQDACCFVM
jgi:hypothetical protein